MDTNNELDFKTIASQCSVGSNENSPDVVINNIANLSEYHTNDELLAIYNYFLTIEKNPKVLTYLVQCQDKYRDESSIQALIDILLFKQRPNDIDIDDYINVRVLVAKAIANHKNYSVVAPLLYCLNNKDEHYKIRLACADALGKIGDKYAVTPLIDLVQDDNEKSVYIKESAASALGAIGDVRAVEPLISILESKQGVFDKFSFLKERVIEALGKLNVGGDRVLKVVKKSLMDSSPMVRINAIEYIMNSECENAYELIKPSLKDEDDEVKKNALIALYNIVGRDILDEVLESDEYGAYIKEEAEFMIEEYETDDEDDNE